MGGRELDVSRETLEMLSAFVALVEKWTTKINLISRNSIQDIWTRHIADSAQLYDLAPSSGRWVDLGSGGGFPGIVAAILSKCDKRDHHFTLVESDTRKAVFLRTAIRELNLVAVVSSDRIEETVPLSADILSARALADLDVLLLYAARHLNKDGVALFSKGAQWQKEDYAARIRWSYDCDPITSKTNPAAAVLKIKDIARV